MNSYKYIVICCLFTLFVSIEGLYRHFLNHPLLSIEIIEKCEILCNNGTEIMNYGPYLDLIKELKQKFRPDMVNHFLCEKIHEMSTFTMDDDSKTSLFQAGKQMILKLQNKNLPEASEYVKKHKEDFEKELPLITEKIKNVPYREQAFHFHHGLRYSSENLKDYVFNGDLLDIGACDGESTFVLASYTSKNVVLYELSPKLTAKIAETIKINADNDLYQYDRPLADKAKIVNAGISNKKEIIFINDAAFSGGSVNMKGKIPVNITTIDDEIVSRGILPKFIKADIEGVGLKMLQGAVDCIRKYRPVLSISIYHCMEEFFGIHEFMKQFPNYMWEFHSENPNLMSFREMSIFLYPAEINYPIFPH